MTPRRPPFLVASSLVLLACPRSDPLQQARDQPAAPAPGPNQPSEPLAAEIFDHIKNMPRMQPTEARIAFPCGDVKELAEAFAGWLPPLAEPRPIRIRDPFRDEMVDSTTVAPAGPWPSQAADPAAPGGEDGVRLVWFVGSLFAAIGQDLGLGDFDTLVPEIDKDVLFPPPGRASTLGRVPRRITEAFATLDAQQRKALYDKVFRSEEKLAVPQWEALHALASKAIAAGRDVCIYQSRPDQPPR